MIPGAARAGDMARTWATALLALSSSVCADERRTAYVHVGPHKVASTYIQNFACSKRAFLASVGIHIPIHQSCTAPGSCGKYFSGIAAPLIDLGASRGHSGPLDWSIPDDGIETLKSLHQCPGETGGAVESLRRSLEEIEGDIFMSAELFDQLRPEGAAYLKDILKGFDVKILIMYREPFDHLVSMYEEYLKQHAIVSPLPSFVVAIGSKWASGLNLDFMLNSYTSAFGEENVYVYGFDGLLDSGEELFGFIVRNFMGKKVGDMSPSSTHQNASPELGFMSLWAFIQETLTIKGVPADEIVKFPLDRENKNGWNCVLKAAPRIITDLRNAWTCWDLAVMDAGIQQRDVEALQSRPLLNLMYVNETKGEDGQYVRRKKEACAVQSAKLVENPSRMQILADMEKLMEVVRHRDPECPWE